MNNQVFDRLTNLHNTKYSSNRHPMWKDIKITVEEIDKRMRRVSSDAICKCRKLISEHPVSEDVMKIYENFSLYELCDGTLGKP